MRALLSSIVQYIVAHFKNISRKIEKLFESYFIIQVVWKPLSWYVILKYISSTTDFCVYIYLSIHFLRKYDKQVCFTENGGVGRVDVAVQGWRGREAAVPAKNRFLFGPQRSEHFIQISLMIITSAWNWY